MNRFAAIALEAFKQVIGKQFDQQVQFICFKIACGDANRLYCGIQIENDVNRQAGTDDFLIERPQLSR